MPETVRFVEFSVAIEPEVAWKLPVKSAVSVAFETLELRALSVVPLAVVKAKIPEEVPFTKVRALALAVPKFAVVIDPEVAWKLVANKLVDVVFVPVAFTQLRFVSPPSVPTFSVVIVPLVPVKDVKARAVVVTLFAETFPSVDVPLTFNVPVAVRFKVWIPPSA